MSLVKEDLGELLFGGAVLGTEWWDQKRINEAKITQKDILKKASFYTYLLVGGGATLASAMGWMRKYDSWMTHVSHGFIYDLPRFAYNTAQSMKTPPGQTLARSRVVEEAQRILNQKRAAAQLAAGRTERSYQPEFQGAIAI